MVHDRITIDPNIMFGKPVIRGTRITVELILRKIGAGLAQQEIVAQHPHLTSADVQAAASFAADELAHEDIILATSSTP